jgi:hypothetical protein
MIPIPPERVKELREWLIEHEYTKIDGIEIPSLRVRQMLAILDDYSALKAEVERLNTWHSTLSEAWKARAEKAEAENERLGCERAQYRSLSDEWREKYQDEMFKRAEAEAELAKPAPLPKEVEEMIHTLDLLADDWYDTSGEYGESPDPEANEAMKPHVEAIRAVLKSALRPKVVSREDVDRLGDAMDACRWPTDRDGVVKSWRIIAFEWLRELGIVVGEKP